MIADTINNHEYNPYYKTYIDKANHEDIVKGLEDNFETVVRFYKDIPLEKHDYAYATGKWTVKDILLHIIDTERIFSYRALRIGRNDKTPIEGFEQDDYAAFVNTQNRSMQSLIEEYKSVRLATISLFKSYTSANLLLIGEASGSPISVRAIGYIITGHENHHNQIIKERYL